MRYITCILQDFAAVFAHIGEWISGRITGIQCNSAHYVGRGFSVYCVRCRGHFGVHRSAHNEEWWEDDWGEGAKT